MRGREADEQSEVRGIDQLVSDAREIGFIRSIVRSPAQFPCPNRWVKFDRMIPRITEVVKQDRGTEGARGSCRGLLFQHIRQRVSTLPVRASCTIIVSKRVGLTFSLTGILILALGLRLWGIGFGLPYKYHIDEPPYVVAALKIASGDLHIEYPFNSPNLFQFILAVEYAVLYVVGRLAGFFHSPGDVANLYQADPSVFYLLARGTSAVLGTATAELTYILGKVVYGRRTGLLAALMLALSFVHVRDSHYAVTDTLVTLLVLACVLCGVLYLKGGRRWHLVLAGLGGGAAVGFKYLPALVLVVPILAILFRLQAKACNKPWQTAIKQFSLLVITAVAGFLLAFPALLISPDLFRLHLSLALGQATNPLGSFLVDTAPAWLYYLRTFTWGLGWPLLVAALGGLLLALVRHYPEDLLLLAGIGGLYVSISLVSTYFARYALPLVPLLVLLTAGFLAGATEVVRGRLPMRANQVAVVLLMLLVLAYPALASVRHDYLLTCVDTRTLAKEWIEASIPSGTRIVAQWFGPPLSTPDDPEPGSTGVYNVVDLNPFITDVSRYDLQTYMADGAAYILINSFNINLRRESMVENAVRQRFYRTLSEETELVAEFQPYESDVEPPFIFDEIYGPAISLWQRERPGPTLKIYRVKERK